MHGITIRHSFPWFLFILCNILCCLGTPAQVEYCTAPWQSVNGDLWGYETVYWRGRFYCASSAWIYTSTDGLTWEPQRNITPDRVDGFWGIAADESRLVAVGWEGAIVTSEDGVNWTGCEKATQETLTSVVHGASGWVAVGDTGVIVTSEDGETWTLAESPPDSGFSGVAYFKGRYFVTRWREKVLVSEDSRTWREEPFPKMASVGFAVGGGLMVALTEYGEVLITTDGSYWTLAVERLNLSDMWAGVYYAGGLFIALSQGTIATSRDGAQWTLHQTPAKMLLRGVAYGAGRYVITGDFNFLDSTDAETWYDQSSSASSLTAACYGQGRYWFVGLAQVAQREFLVTSSMDGFTWRTRHIPDYAHMFPLGAASGNQGLVAVGYEEDATGRPLGGMVLWSPDGEDWAPQDLPTTDLLIDVTSTGNLYVAVGTGGLTLRSPDGRAWEGTGRVTEASLYAVAYGVGTFVAVGSGGAIIRSADGVTWSPAQSGVTNDLFGVTFGGGEFVAVGRRDVGDPMPCVLTSSNGRTWVRQTLVGGDNYDLQEVLYAEGAYFGVGDYYTLLRSQETVRWESLPSDAQYPLLQLIHDDGVIMGGGNGFVSASYCTPAAHAASAPSSGASPLNVRFSALLRGGAPPSSYLWDFGDGARDTAKDPEHLFASPGFYNVHLEVTDAEGGIYTDDSVQIVVSDGGPCPLSGCTASVPETTAEGSPILFLSASHSPPDCAPSFEWNYGDGSPRATEQAVSYAYDAAGDYDWSLQVSLGGDTCSQHGTIRVTSRPVIRGIAKLTNPFRLRIDGEGFRPGCVVKIDGVEVPISEYKYPKKVLAKGGDTLKGMIPRRQVVQVTVTNTDDGGGSLPFPFSR